MIHMQESAASSVMRFCNTHRDKYRELLRTGDITDSKRGQRGAPTFAHRERIDAEMETAIARIRDGVDAAMVARSIGVKPATFYARLRNRGLTVRGLQSTQ